MSFFIVMAGFGVLNIELLGQFQHGVLVGLVGVFEKKCNSRSQLPPSDCPAARFLTVNSSLTPQHGWLLVSGV